MGAPPAFLPTGPSGARHGFAPSGFLEPCQRRGNGRADGRLTAGLGLALHDRERGRGAVTGTQAAS